MAYTKPTLSELYERVKADMEARLTSDVKIPKVSLFGVLATVIGGASFLVYGFLDWIQAQTFVDTSDATGAARWGGLYRLPQKPAEYATGVVSFTGTAGYTVPTGEQVESSDGAVYETQDDFVIGTTVRVNVEAVEAGASGNTDDTTLSLVSPSVDIDTEVTVVSGFDDGADTETLEAWINRLLQRSQNPPASGTTGDYERWGLEVGGVSYAWGFDADNWNGAGTVGLAVSGPDFAQLGAGVVSDVQDYIDTVKPSPAVVTVFSPDQVSVDFDISITPNTTELQDAIEAAVEELYATDAAPAATMLVSRLATTIGAAGVSDYEINDITVDGTPIGAANFTVAKTEIPVVGSFSFSAV